MTEIDRSQLPYIRKSSHQQWHEMIKILHNNTFSKHCRQERKRKRKKIEAKNPISQFLQPAKYTASRFQGLQWTRIQDQGNFYPHDFQSSFQEVSVYRFLPSQFGAQYLEFQIELLRRAVQCKDMRGREKAKAHYYMYFL